PPPTRLSGRNADWKHVYCRDVISMPDKWEYPWFAAWDLAFHMIPFAPLDPQFTKDQLVLFLREWYMHPNGQIPAYEFALGDVNPPVHAWACWRAYKVSAARGERDHAFLERAFHKLMLNFTWWVNRKDVEGKHLFAGGFLGLDNIGVFDRSQPLPGGGYLEQADGTAWMAFYSATMLAIALELARDNSAYEDVASKFFEHFVAIAEAMNRLGGDGLWHEEDGFYYDQLHSGDARVALRIRSLVGVVPLFACELIDDEVLDRLPSFAKRVRWFLENRPDLASQITCMHAKGGERGERRLLAIPSRERLTRVLGYALDEREFLSPHGLRALSRVHADLPYVLHVDGIEHRVDYVPAESNTGLFGGNSNWRGPVWFPLNYLLIEALERYHQFYGESLRVECPTGSGRPMNLKEVAHELSRRLAGLFLPDARGHRPCHGGERRYADDPHWRDLVLFSEYFDGDTGRGVGASHQTGWTALAVRCVEDVARARASGADAGRAAQPARSEAPGGSSR
ncbi:MAG TPA: glucosidase, partial [Kofleriaceae bacterium]|nr:glucosidase [Kofleriaceae bacterium]